MQRVRRLKSAEEEREKTVWPKSIFVTLLATIGSALFANLFSFVIAASGPTAINVSRLAVFFLGILLLSVIIVGLAGFLRRRNREVILLKQQISEIYLSALHKSAFNPQTKSNIATNAPSHLHSITT